MYSVFFKGFDSISKSENDKGSGIDLWIRNLGVKGLSFGVLLKKNTIRTGCVESVFV